MQYISKNIKFLIPLAGLGAAAILIAGCSSSSVPPSTVQDTSNTTPDQNAPQTQMTPLASPNVAAQDTDDAATNEGTQLNALNKDSTSIDQSFNDQAVNVQ